MRVISKARRKEFWELAGHEDAEGALPACEHYPIEAASDVDMLRHLMEAKRVTQSQLSRETTVPTSTISEVLAGKKQFSRPMIRKFADYFQVDASVLTANF
jgi:HTH-type transcriptional regulator / antitoxin HigA